jgi:hypothetical protein
MGLNIREGTLASYEIRKYPPLKNSAKTHRSGAESVPLRVEHMLHRVKGGGRISKPCHQPRKSATEEKGVRDIKDFFGHPP